MPYGQVFCSSRPWKGRSAERPKSSRSIPTARCWRASRMPPPFSATARRLFGFPKAGSALTAIWGLSSRGSAPAGAPPRTGCAGLDRRHRSSTPSRQEAAASQPRDRQVRSRHQHGSNRTGSYRTGASALYCRHHPLGCRRARLCQPAGSRRCPKGAPRPMTPLT